MLNRKKDIDNWVTFSQNYLKIAELACLEMLENKHREQLKHVYVPNFTENDLFIPTLYNIKHGIEVFIKTLKFTLSENLSREDFKHDTKYLFDKFKNELQKHKIESVIKRELEKNPESVNLRIANDNLKSLSIWIKKAEKLVQKYYYCDFIQENIKNSFHLEDTGNTLFRYPENNTKMKIDYNQFISEISRKDDLEKLKREILKDIEDLLNTFNDLGFLFYVYKKHS